MKREDFKCEHCESSDITLNVHHAYYERGRKPWDYPSRSLHCLCQPCHEKTHWIMNQLLDIIQSRVMAPYIREIVDFVIAVEERAKVEERETVSQ